MPKRIYQTMNGLRGLAAVIVVMFHMPEWFGALTPSRGFLAVDLFFVLSGFVIALSYEDQFKSNLTPKRFFIIRMIRLYPLYAIGSLIQIVVLFMSLYFKKTIIDQNIKGWISIPFALAMLPTPDFSNSSAVFYPLNHPAWSLFCEVFINMVYVATWRWWSTKNIAIIMVTIGSLMLARPEFCNGGGFSWEDIDVGIVRVFYSFPAGVLIYRLLSANKVRFPHINSFAVLGALPILLMLPGEWVARFCVLFGFPFLAFVAAQSEPTVLIRPLFAALGAASYAIYVIHIPLIHLVSPTLIKLGFIMKSQLIEGVFLVVAIVLVSLLIDAIFDTPIRRFLSRAFLRPHTPEPVQSAVQPPLSEARE
ncbi:MAG: acyltransferase [Methylocystis sp.]